MIVDATSSGILEFFWRHRAKTAILRIRPGDFLTLRTRQADIRCMREWLGLQPGCTSVRDIDDPRVLKRIAEAVRSREIAIAELPVGPRLPGTGIAINSVLGPVLLLPYRKLSRETDLSWALDWLRTRDPSQLAWLRAILSDADEWSSRNLEKVVDIQYEVERLLKRGELIAVCTHYPTIDRERIAGAPAANPPDLKRLNDPVDTPEPGTFDMDHAVAAQTSTMIAAAESGVPFCEVCNQK